MNEMYDPYPQYIPIYTLNPLPLSLFAAVILS